MKTRVSLKYSVNDCKLWKDRILNCRGNSMSLYIFNHHLIKKNDNLRCLNRLGSRELYQIQISE